MPDPLANARAGMPLNHAFAIVETADGHMGMFCAYPDGPGPFPAAVVVSGQPGPSSPEILGAEILANRGYLGCAIDLFHRGPWLHSTAEERARGRDLTDPQITLDMNAGLDYLKTLPFVQSDSFGIIGFCQGGRVAYLMAGLRSDIHAICCLYGTSMYQGNGGPAPIENTPNVKSPVLILHGEDDPVITADEYRKFAAEIEQQGKTVEAHYYPGIGHAFMATRGSKETSDDAWFRCLAWLDRYLGPKQPEFTPTGAPAGSGGK